MKPLVLTLLALGCADTSLDTGAGAIDPLDGGVAAGRNVLVISVDTTRPDELGFFGGAADTPHLDALLAESLVFEQHHSCSNWTFASTLCVQSGRSSLDMGLIPFLNGLTTPVPSEEVLGPEVLAARGWDTTLISTNEFIGERTGLSQGFDEVISLPSAPARTVTNTAIERIGDAEASDQPWMVHAHYFDPHAPYSPPEDFRAHLNTLQAIDYDLDTGSGYQALNEDFSALSRQEKFLILRHLEARYRGELSYVDAQIGRLLDGLEAAGALEDTVVVLWTDHGEQLLERGDLGHAFSLHREENRSLAAFRAPGLAPVGYRGATLHQDIWPTLFTLLGEPIPSSFGTSPLQIGAPERPVVTLRHLGEGVRLGLVRDGYKLLYGWDWEREAAGEAPEISLFSLRGDPMERNNLGERDLHLRNEMVQALLPSIEGARALYE